MISLDTCELRYPGSRRPATAVVDAGDGEAKAGPFGPGSGGVRCVRERALSNPRSRRLRVLSGGQEGIKGPALLHRACACTGIQHSRGRGIAAMLAKLRRSRATMASGGNRKRMATTFGSCTRTVVQGIPRANYDVHRPSAGSTWWLARIRFGRRSPWVDGVGVAGVAKARCGTVVLGLAVPLVAAVGVRRSSRRRFPSAQLLMAAPARRGCRCGGVGAAPARRLLGLGVGGSFGTRCGHRRGPERRAGEAKKKSWRKMLGVEPVLAVEIGVACLSY